MSLAANHPLQEAEVAFLEKLRSEYETKGYRFIIHPSRSDLPEFLAAYEPDAVARRSDHNVAIEVKSRATPTVEQSLQRIRKLFEGRPDWQFTVAYVGSDMTGIRRLPVPTFMCSFCVGSTVSRRRSHFEYDGDERSRRALSTNS